MTFLATPAAVGAADDLLALARSSVDADIGRIDADTPVSCGPGCATCCVRPVPVTGAELRSIAAFVDELPPSERSAIRTRTQHTATTLRSAGFDTMSLSGIDRDDRREFARRYFDQQVPCPLLDDHGSCRVHPVRPLACREYVVTSDPSHCGEFASEAAVRIRPRRDIVGGFAAVSAALGEPHHLLLAAALADELPPAPEATPMSGPALAELLVTHRLSEKALRPHRKPSDAELRAVQIAEALDVDVVIERYRRDYDLDPATARANMAELLRFLVLGATAEPWRAYPMYGAPNGVDAAWHTFLLFTRRYADFCDQLGGFIHHVPRDDDADPDGPDDYDDFLGRYHVVFGEPAPEAHWPRRPTVRDEHG